MAINVSRVQLLRGDITGKAAPIRPPWTLEETQFLDACSRCGECTKVCESGILVSGQGGYPQIKFSKGECTFCQACVRVCKEPAFMTTDSEPWPYKAIVGDHCLAHQGVVCMVCAEQCETRAIHFPLQAHRVAQPQIDSVACNGCGACYQPCPANAIQFETISQQFNHQSSQSREIHS